MIILERSCVLVTLYEVIRAYESEEDHLVNIFNAIQYSHSSVLCFLQIIQEL